MANKSGNPFTNPFAPIAPNKPGNSTGGGKVTQPTAPGTTPWPLSIQLQAQAIAAAMAQHGVPMQVFMGMYSLETNYGFYRNADGSVRQSSSHPPATGPFQFTGQKAGVPNYPMTGSPSFSEFVDQADAAAAYLKQLFNQSPAPHTWHWALAAYNAGPRNVSAGDSYATQAMHVQVPLNWQAWIGSSPALPGGIAGFGGHGTLVNAAGIGLTSGFKVGDPANPDEDYWTAINRLAQERYWYVFSDGETLYLADGPDLMKQVQAAKLDRIGNLDQINHLDFCWDNTAWQYAATRKKRKRAQRRTHLAKITSPVEATLELVCAIDECRAGDVISFTNTGPGDGDWLVGTCRRSVFEVKSEINMVVALTPLTEGELNPAGINKNNLSSQLGGIGTGVGKYKNYVNPVGNWTPNRIDAGVDGTLTSPYIAPGDSLILEAETSDPGWRGSGYIAGRLLNGPLKGLIWYVTEGVAPLVQPHAVVKAGSPVARLATSPYGNSYGKGAWGAIETGWANPAAPRQPAGYGDDQGPRAIAYGSSFNRFLTKLGASPGALHGRGIHTAPASLPPNYP